MEMLQNAESRLPDVLWGSLASGAYLSKKATLMLHLERKEGELNLGEGPLSCMYTYISMGIH